MSKGGAYQSGIPFMNTPPAKAPGFPVNIIEGWKGLPEIDGLANLAPPKEKTDKLHHSFSCSTFPA